MKLLLVIVVLLLIGGGALWYAGGGKKPKNAKSLTSIYDLAFTTIDGVQKPMADFRGKKILIVNVASQCGFTPQYEELEQLYLKHRERLEIIGFPANDFMGQEPGTNDEIKSFCTLRYGVTFWLSEKGSVVGEGKSAVFRWLTEKGENGWNGQEPRWNFYKYLISETGELLKVFPSTVRPMSTAILEAIEVRGSSVSRRSG
jgi:glutathione peroxidase